VYRATLKRKIAVEVRRFVFLLVFLAVSFRVKHRPAVDLDGTTAETSVQENVADVLRGGLVQSQLFA